MAINDDLRQMYANDLGYSGDIVDLERAWLISKIGVSYDYSIPDLWKIYLNWLGYSGSINEMKSFLDYPINPSGGLQPPTNSIFIIDDDGAYLIDDDGAYLIEAI